MVDPTRVRDAAAAAARRTRIAEGSVSAESVAVRGAASVGAKLVAGGSIVGGRELYVLDMTVRAVPTGHAVSYQCRRDRQALGTISTSQSLVTRPAFSNRWASVCERGGQRRSIPPLPRFVLLPGVEPNLFVHPIMPIEQGLLIESVSRGIPAGRLGGRQRLRATSPHRPSVVVRLSVLQQQHGGRRVRNESNRLYGCHGPEPVETCRTRQTGHEVFDSLVTPRSSLAVHCRAEDLVVMAGVGAADIGAATGDPDQIVYIG